MRFTYTPDYGILSYDTFSWLTGEYDPNNMYALDERGKQHEQYVENLESYGIWFIKGWIGSGFSLFVDNYANVWTQEEVYVKERGMRMTRCPYKKKDYTHSTTQLPDQVIEKIINKEWNVSSTNATRDILTQFEEWKQDIEDERNGLKQFTQTMDASLKAEFRKNIALLKSGQLTYELMPPITPAKTVPQSELGKRWIIANPIGYVVVDSTGQIWSLGKPCHTWYCERYGTPFVTWGGDEPTRRGERLTYSLPTILAPFVEKILAYRPAAGTVDPSMFNLAGLQPIAKYLFDNFASDDLKQNHDDEERLYAEEISRKEEACKMLEEEVRQKAIAEETRRAEEAARIKAEEEAAAEAKRAAQELRAKQIAQAQAELLEAQQRLHNLMNQ